MGRRKTKAADEAPAPAAPAPAIGGNVSDETARKHYSKIVQIEAKLASVKQELKTAWETAESDGISKKPFKEAMRRMKDDPAAADAYMRQLQQYTTQLGLFDRIEQWKQGEDTADNAASVEAAERELADA